VTAAPQSLTETEVRELLERQVALWNAGDKDSWLELWSAWDLTMEDPVGRRAREGQEALDYLSRTWDRAPAAKWRISYDTLIVCGTEAASLVHNDGKFAGEPYRLTSIETYRFEGRRALWRAFWSPPPGRSVDDIMTDLGSPFG
jgi:hypothetical protein